MKTGVKTNYLISEVKAQVKTPFSEWYVGTSEQDNAWRRSNAHMIVFNVLDCEATVAAYEYLVSAGMMARKPMGHAPNFLYLYNVEGDLPAGFIH